MKRETYQRGVPGAKWGIWNCSRKEFQFDIPDAGGGQTVPENRR